MKLPALVLATLLVTGCTNPFVRIVEVDRIVPIPCPEPAVVSKPQLPIHYLEHGDSFDTVVKSYVNSVILLQGYSEELEQALEPYKDGH